MTNEIEPKVNRTKKGKNIISSTKFKNRVFFSIFPLSLPGDYSPRSLTGMPQGSQPNW